jgi:hypothetical protein
MSKVVWKSGGYKDNLTVVNVMLNSNRRILIQQAEDDFKVEMNEMFEKMMQDFSEYLFGNDKVIKLVEVEAFGVEVGSKQKHGHIHTTFKIVHKFPFYSIKKLKARFTLWLNTYSGTQSWAIYAEIARDAVKINYNNKEEHQKENIKNIHNDYEYEEMNRLSDEQKLEEARAEMNALYI